MAFIGWHNHTDRSNFRLRDSINKVDELINYAHQLGHSGIAITDHETISAHLSAQEYVNSKKANDPSWENFKLFLGNEIYLCPDDVVEGASDLIFPHFLLIALNGRGHEQLRELSTIAWSQSFRWVSMRVPTYMRDIEQVIGKDPGNVIASTACLGGSLPSNLLLMRESEYKKEIWDAAIQWINHMKQVFGKDNFFLEMQPSNSDEQIYVNQQLLKLSQITSTPYVITTDSHYLKKEDKLAHKIYLASQDGDREVDSFYDTTYVMSEQEIHEYMDLHLGAEHVAKGIENTMLIYDRVEEFDLTKPLRIPYVPMNTEEPVNEVYLRWKEKIPILEELYTSKYDSDRHLARDLLNALDTDEQFHTEETYKEITTCIRTLLDSSDKQNVRWSAYLLQVADFVKLAWQASIVGPGRGSGVGFILNYMLGITQINPLRETTRTFAWRFLNPERASVLDIDIDISGFHREEVINILLKQYGADRISKVMTLSTEKSRSAILTACRGLGIGNDVSGYMSSLIKSDRGMIRSLKQMYEGSDEFEADPQFCSIMDEYPEVWEMAQKFEGLVCGVGSHAGGIILTDEPFTKTTALMKTNRGDIITQFDLHECEKVSLIKFDLLSVEALDKIMVCMDLLIQHGYMERKPTLKETYEKYIGVYTLERSNLSMWKMLWDRKVISFFQMEKESGIQAVALSKPKSVDDLATINSVMRLMPQEKGAETPLQKYARFSHDITEWYKEMDEWGLTQEEQEILKEIIGISNGICEAQEYLVLLTGHPAIGGMSLGWSDKLRKAVAKKRPKDFMQLEKEFFENAKAKHLSMNLCNYVWKVLINTQRGYSFNKSHCLAYSICGLQELNLAWKYPTIYWNCANLIVAAGASEDSDDQSTDYAKVATIIGAIQSTGTKIVPPDINTASFSFEANEERNQIVFSLKGINGVNDDVANKLIRYRPYTSLLDFYQKLIDTKLVKNNQMLKLIKAGCFNNLTHNDAAYVMQDYISHYLVKNAEKLTLAQLKKMLDLYEHKYLDIPESIINLIVIRQFFGFVTQQKFLYKIYTDPSKKQVKKEYHDRYFLLNDNAQKYFEENFSEESVIEVVNGRYVISEKLFEKELKQKLQPLVDWLADENTVNIYNQALFREQWDQVASGSKEQWDFEALTCYPERHELYALNNEKYGVVDFFQLPEEPEVHDYKQTVLYKNGERIHRAIPRYSIVRIAGTVIERNKDKHKVVVLTTTGIVTAKFSKTHFLYYDRNIGGSDTAKREKSWFSRGNKIMVAGYRRGDEFRTCVYSDTIYKQPVNLIEKVYDNRDVLLKMEREIYE